MLTSVHNRPSLLLTLLAAILVTSLHAVSAADITFLEGELDGDYDVVADARISSPAKLDARFVLDYQESGDHYSLTLARGKAQFHKVTNGKPVPIGTTGDLTPLPDGAETIPLTVQRRDWRMALVWGDRVIARAYDSSLQGGQTGYILTAGGTLEELMIQPVGDIFITDDFVREEGGASAWEVAAGKWEQRSIRDDQQADRQEADKSANAFSYLGKAAGDKPATTTTGYWFWDIYTMQAAVKPLDNRAVGLVIYFQDTENYIAIRWLGKDHPESGKLQVISVTNGTPHTIAETPGGFLPNQWYCLRAAVAEGTVHVWVDDGLRLVASTDAFGQGKVGLYTESTKGVFFDDVACGPWELFSEDFATQAPGKWQTRDGSWKQADGALKAAGNQRCIVTTGRTAWQHYEYSINVQPAASGACGLIVAFHDPGNYCLLRWSPKGTPYAGKAQILHVVDGHESLLAEAPVILPQKTSYRATADLQDGLVTLAIEGRPQLEAFDPGLSAGAVGLFTNGAAGAKFDNALLEIIPPRDTSRIVREFTDTSKHPEMAEWASTNAPWVKPESEGRTWWTKGDYFGDHALVFAIPDVGSKTGSLDLIIGADSSQDTNACKLVATLKSGSKDIAMALHQGDKLIAEGKATAKSAQAKISLERRGRWLVVLLDDQFVLKAETGSPQPQAVVKPPDTAP